MKNAIIIIIGIASISMSCTEFKDDKEAFAKKINMVGESELIRDVNFEKFDVSKNITVAKIKVIFQDQYKFEKDNYIANLNSSIDIEKSSIKSNQSLVDIFTGNALKDMRKEYQDKIKASENAIEQLKTKISDTESGLYETERMKTYKQMVEKAEQFIIKDDIVAFSYDVEYIVEAALGKVKNKAFYVVTPYEKFVQKEDINEAIIAQYLYAESTK